MSDDQNKPKKRSGPSMREQIAARRRAEAQPTNAGGSADAAPAKPMPKRAQRTAAAAKPAATKPAATKPAATKKAAPAAEESAERPARRRSGGASSRSSARRAGGTRSRRGGDDEDEEGGSARGRRGRAPQKKSPLPLVAAGLIVVGLGAGGWYAMNSGKAEASETEESGEGAKETADATDDAATDGANAAAADATAGDAGADSAAAGDADPATAPDAPAEEATPEEKPAAKEPAPMKTGIRDGFDPVAQRGRSLKGLTMDELNAMVDALEPFDPPAGVAADAWTEAKERAALTREGGGRRVTKAHQALAESGQVAFPAILNELIEMDLNDPEMMMNAKQMTDTLNTARGSTNEFGFGWRPSPSRTELPELKDQLYNRMMLIQIYVQWEKVVADPGHWQAKLWKGEEYESDNKRVLDDLQNELDGDVPADDEFDFGG